MKVFTPAEHTMFPIQRGESLLHRVLKRGEPYLIPDSAGEQWESLIAEGLASGRIEAAESRPITDASQRRLFFMDGDIGDAVVVRLAIERLMARRERRSVFPNIGFVTPHGDWSLYQFQVCPVFEFPISLRQAETYDAWAEFNLRNLRDEDPVTAFGNLVGVKPVEPIWAPAVPGMVEAVSHLMPGTGRPSVGLCPRTASHYRSWHGEHATIVASGLVEAGFDCYFFGPLNRRLEFRKNGGENVLWGDGLYDLQGRFSTVEEHAACLANMDAVIAPDGGDLLLSCALQKPTVGLFWCTSGERYVKHAPTLKCLQAKRECSPCWCLSDRAPCDEAYCLAVSSIDPEDVVKTVQQTLEATDAT